MTRYDGGYFFSEPSSLSGSENEWLKVAPGERESFDGFCHSVLPWEPTGEGMTIHKRVSTLLVLAALLGLQGERSPAVAQSKPRARDLGIPFDGTPGPLNAITDVKGVEVGHTTLISGSGKLIVGSGPVRTGVTAILPRGKQSTDQSSPAGFLLTATAR